MVGVARIELATPAMSTQCSTTELYAHAARPLAVQIHSFKCQSASGWSKLACRCLAVEQAFDFEHQILEVKGL